MSVLQLAKAIHLLVVVQTEHLLELEGIVRAVSFRRDTGLHLADKAFARGPVKTQGCFRYIVIDAHFPGSQGYDALGLALVAKRYDIGTGSDDQALLHAIFITHELDDPDSTVVHKSYTHVQIVPLGQQSICRKRPVHGAALGIIDSYGILQCLDDIGGIGIVFNGNSVTNSLGHTNGGLQFCHHLIGGRTCSQERFCFINRLREFIAHLLSQSLIGDT